MTGQRWEDMAGLGDHLRRKIAEDFFGNGGYAGAFKDQGTQTVQDVNARIKAKPSKLPDVKVTAYENEGSHRASVVVLVPNAFGTPEPLLDGVTGRPVDFFEDFGDPRGWTRNMGPEIRAAAVRAGQVCAALVRSRGALASG